jgi:ubiquitin-conjugating enzyme E2 D/E
MASRFRRIGKEIQQFLKDPPDHIFIDFNEEDMTHLEVLFIGPRYTPYSRMFMRFTVDFPGEYPIKPPKVVFTSSYNRKIHPNVFPGGWLCLSTLNTGDASGWVPSINFTALMTTIYSMFTKEMIMIDNTHSHEKSTDFFPGVIYDTFYINSRLLNDEKNAKFKKIMQDYTNVHREWYVRKLERLSEDHDGKDLKNYYQARKANFKSLIPAFLSKEE